MNIETKINSEEIFKNLKNLPRLWESEGKSSSRSHLFSCSVFTSNSSLLSISSSDLFLSRHLVFKISTITDNVQGKKFIKNFRYCNSSANEHVERNKYLLANEGDQLKFYSRPIKIFLLFGYKIYLFFRQLEFNREMTSEDRKFEAKVDSGHSEDWALHPEQELRFEAEKV